MNKSAIIYWGSLFCWCIIIYISSISLIKSCENNTSSPVEEMYHGQLVTTLDSILDARFGSGCCEENIDIDTTYTMKAGFKTKFVPIE